MAYGTRYDDSGAVLDAMNSDEARELRNKSHDLLVELRSFMLEQCPISRNREKNGAYVAMKIRNTDVGTTPTCRALAELEYMLYHVSDGIFYEVTDELIRREYV